MKRTFVVGDIHGCNRTFRELLLECISLKKNDTLYLLGDYIDRGPDSKGVLDTIIKLQRDGFDVRPLLGNHEDMLLQALRTGEEEDLSGWLENGGVETLDSYGVDSPDDIPKEYIEFLEALPLYHVDDLYVFVHAGLNFFLDNPLTDEGREAMLWERGVEVETDKIGGRKLITGHTIMNIDEIYDSLDSDLIQLDNGCWMGDGFRGRGNLVVLELESGELFIQENIEGNRP